MANFLRKVDSCSHEILLVGKLLSAKNRLSCSEMEPDIENNDGD